MQTVFRVTLLLAVTVFSFGCAPNYYNIPQETYEKKVRVLGVAPLMVDAESDIKHPEKEALLTIVKEANRKVGKELVSRLKETGVYFSVRELEDDPATLFANIVTRREWRDDAGIIYNKYFYKKEELNNLISKNGLDAVMLVTVSGLTKKDKVSSSNLLAYLETDYNFLSMTAQIMDGAGNTLWEYPNFRQRSPSYPMFFPLQYPDFDEAAANLSDKVDVKFKSIAGITTAFNRTQSTSLLSSIRNSVLYSAMFDDMVSMLNKDKPLWPLFGTDKPPAPPAPKTETK
jgi:hypothetical protein